MNILLVDDELPVLKRLSQLLRSFDLQQRGFAPPIRCQRAAQALELVRDDSREIGLLCCDLQMPDMDGVAFLRELERSSYRGGLALIGNDSERLLHSAERVARAYRLRVLGSLHVPLGPERLRRQLDGMLCRAAPAAERSRIEDFSEPGRWAYLLH
jgi:CheY-like chemotaxis protein